MKRKGHEVLIAENGADGVDIAEQEMPDLILMDLNLPIMDSWTAATKIKENEKTSSIPVIALSAHAMSEHREKAQILALTIMIPNPWMLTDFYPKWVSFLINL